MIAAFARNAAAPAFLFLALLLGGSSRGVWPDLVLQLLAIALFAWTALAAGRQDSPASVRPLRLILVAGLAWILLQLVPLPPSVWPQLPGREPVERGYALLGQGLPWLPVSLDPYGTLASALALLPPVALASAVVARPARDVWLAVALLAGTCLGVVLGAMQAASGGPGRSGLFLYDITNSGAVGFFANRNHMGTLLLASLPFAFALLRTARSGGRRHFGASAGLVGATILLIVVGIVLNGSTAVLLLGLPVLGLSILLLPIRERWRRPLAASTMLLMILAALLMILAPVGGSAESLGQISLQSRLQIWQASLSIARDVFPAGSGLGSFEAVFHLTEDVARTTGIYVNHAHNDYLELILELGLPGAVLLAAFLGWWGRQAAFLWTSPVASVFARAASIVSAVILAQSFVDYPLRTSAIACVLGACLALMARPIHTGASGAESAGGARHVIIR